MPRESDLTEIISDLSEHLSPADAVIVSDPAPRRPIPTVQHRPVRTVFRGEDSTPSAAPEADYAYSPLIRRVTVLPWPRSFNYYQRFTDDAQRFSRLSGREAPYVPYVAYTPQYSNMSREQLAYYFFFREQCRARALVDQLDFAYIMLYIYELINLPHLPPAEGVSVMAWLWLNYRGRFPEIDKYLVEWMCDYCLIHALPVPAELSPILPEIVWRSMLKEFWLAPAGDADGGIPPMGAEDMIAFVSDYDYHRSRVYPKHPEEFDRMIPAAVDYAAERCGMLSALQMTRPAKAERDAFCGSLCAQTAKRRIRLEYLAFSRAREMRDAVTQAVKLAENQLRRRLSVSARLKIENPDPAVVRAMEEFFGEKMPMKRERRAAAAAEERKYEHLYDAPSGGIDTAAARRLEAESWENTALLAAEGFTDAPPSAVPAPSAVPIPPAVPAPSEVPIPSAVPAPPEVPIPSAVPAPPESASASAGGLTADQISLLRALLDGTPIASWCAPRKIDPNAAAAALNDCAMDTLGDIILEDESGAGAWRLIEDYTEDIRTWITASQN